MIEFAGSDAENPSIGWQTRGQRQCGSVSLMARVLETCDLDAYVDDQGVLEWEASMSAEINSLNKNQLRELVPQPQGNKVMKFRWVYKTIFTFDGIVESHNGHLVAMGFLSKNTSNTIENFILS